jgi:hypothetical protein
MFLIAPCLTRILGPLPHWHKYYLMIIVNNTMDWSNHFLQTRLFRVCWCISHHKLSSGTIDICYMSYVSFTKGSYTLHISSDVCKQIGNTTRKVCPNPVKLMDIETLWSKHCTNTERPDAQCLSLCLFWRPPTLDHVCDTPLLDKDYGRLPQWYKYYLMIILTNTTDQFKLFPQNRLTMMELVYFRVCSCMSQHLRSAGASILVSCHIFLLPRLFIPYLFPQLVRIHPLNTVEPLLEPSGPNNQHWVFRRSVFGPLLCLDAILLALETFRVGVNATPVT